MPSVGEDKEQPELVSVNCTPTLEDWLEVPIKVEHIFTLWLSYSTCTKTHVQECLQQQHLL